MNDRKIMVYFHNGCKAQFDADKVEFYGHDNIDSMRHNDLAKNLLDDGFALINLDNVSFIQLVKEEKDEST